MWQLPLVLTWLVTLMTGAAAVPRSRRRSFLESARLVFHSLALPVAPQDWTPARARRERLRSAMHCTRAATRYSLGCGMLRAELCCERLTTPEGAASERRQAGR